MPASVADVLAAPCERDPGHEALVTQSGRWTYDELDRRANQAAHALVSLGVGPGDRVACALPNDIDVVAAFHGAMRAGAVWLGVNRTLAPPEQDFLLTDSGASLFLADAATLELRLSPAPVRTIELEPGRSGEWSDAMSAAPDQPLDLTIDPFAPAGLAYTSGTTGRPKGVVHSQYNMVVPGAAIVATRRWGPSLRKGDQFVFTILNVQILGSVLTAQAGGCLVLMDRSDAGGIAEWIRRERVTLWTGPPALHYSLAHDAGVAAEDLASLEEAWAGGGDCPESIRRAFAAKFGRRPLATYGLTEAPTVVTFEVGGSTHAPGSSGRPLPHLDVRIVDGEICVGPTIEGAWTGVYRPMLEYWNRPDATAETLHDGLLHTGDIGYLDDEGDLHVTDRKSLMLVRGGANVYPAEIERVLHELPQVEACAVVGLPDERLGERVVAVVQFTPGAALTDDELTAHCGANLARYKVPERWVVVDELPRNAMGKIVRQDLPALFLT